jgi:hypothetical protein
MIIIRHRNTGRVLVEWNVESLRGMDLRGVDLRSADLSGLDLRGVDLRGTDLGDADLRGADLTKARFWETRLFGAVYDPSTRWPDPGLPAWYDGAILVKTPVRKQPAEVTPAAAPEGRGDEGSPATLEPRTARRVRRP